MRALSEVMIASERIVRLEWNLGVIITIGVYRYHRCLTLLGLLFPQVSYIHHSIVIAALPKLS